MAKSNPGAKPVVGLFAKPPRAGTVKTRLCPPLSPEQAASLYAAFLGDLADMLDGGPAWEWMVYSPEPELQEAAWSHAPRPHGWRRQTKNDLGDRMSAALEELLVDERPKAILLGSDHPTVTRNMIADGFDALDRAEVVLGPTVDGGLYLVGWTRPHPEIFVDVPWSTERVLDTVIARAKAHHVQTALIAPWYDVDDARDLGFLREHLAALELELESNAPCPRTRAELKRGS
jgi:rSAM/selenodomain-associated transferase 1